ncbi:MAG: acyl carrier protein [Erysipelotrichaceae bacterium]|nr:acyl carrier protein [Erysipelotrichaceae bacterium]
MDNLDLLKRLLAEKVKNPESITPDATMKDLGIDSLDLVDVVVSMEEELGISFEDDELLGLKSVQDVLNLVDKKTK